MTKHRPQSTEFKVKGTDPTWSQIRSSQFQFENNLLKIKVF